ncbi:uncharacterized protein [Diabrotica undecimpunctata]|uniref:uncharacterized protein n=1 Tax=Diabrotica undecimpunctata TaxID=50387 RepID=UPI003B636C51
MLFKAVIIFIFNIYCTNGAVFLWSNHELNISPLEEFSTNNFVEIIERFKSPDVFVFKSPSALSETIKPILKGYYSIYNPNGVIELENIIDLTGNSEQDIKTIQSTIADSRNFISVVIIPNRQVKRSKRQAQAETEGYELEQSEKDAPPIGPVIYRAQKSTKDDLKVFALLYSSKALLLRKNESEGDIYLGNTAEDMITYNTHPNPRLNIIVPVEGKGKFTLRFNFNWKNGYWYMSSVKIEETQSPDYTLYTLEDIYAAESFSYHCNGLTLFQANGTELYIYDLQVQIDSRNGKFGDANDCVPFITVPIWSGIFITFILGIGMVIALFAIMDIKTMDKFDNYKTKNLAITVSD